MRRRIRPSVFAGLLAIGFGLGLLASLEVRTEASHVPGAGGQTCESDPPATVSFGDATLPCASGMPVRRLGCQTTAAISGASGALALAGTPSAGGTGFRAPIPITLDDDLLTPSTQEVGLTAIAAGDFDNDGWVDLLGSASNVYDPTNQAASRYVVFVKNRTYESTLGLVSTWWGTSTNVATPRFEACTDAAADNDVGAGVGDICKKGYLNGEDYAIPQGTFPDLPKGGPVAVVTGRFDRYTGGSGESARNLDALVIRTKECTGADSCLYQQKNCVFRVYLGAGLSGSSVDSSVTADGMFKLQVDPPQPMPGDNPSCTSGTSGGASDGYACNEFGEIDWTSNVAVAVDWDSDGDDDIIAVRSNETNPVPFLMRNCTGDTNNDANCTADVATTSTTSRIVKFKAQAIPGLPTTLNTASPDSGDNPHSKRGLSTVAVGDIDRNGFPDLVYAGLGNRSGYSDYAYFRWQTSANIWPGTVDYIDSTDGGFTFLVVGDLDGGDLDIISGRDNWNYKEGQSCAVSRGTTAGSCTDFNGYGLGGQMRMWSTTTDWSVCGGPCSCSVNYAQGATLSCHGDSPGDDDGGSRDTPEAGGYIDPSAALTAWPGACPGSQWDCGDFTGHPTATPNHGASRDGLGVPGGSSDDDPTAGVIYDWDTAVLVNYDNDYNCDTDGETARRRNPGYRTVTGASAANNPPNTPSGFAVQGTPPPGWALGAGNGCAAGNDDRTQTASNDYGNLDLIVADGNDSQRLWVFPNRGGGGSTYPLCTLPTDNWSDWSDPVTLGGTDTIVSACVTLSWAGAATDPGVGQQANDNIDLEISNGGEQADGSQNAVFVATPVASASIEDGCPGGGSYCYCATFPVRDRRLVWRARLCPAATAGPGPTIATATVGYRTLGQGFANRGGVAVDATWKYVAQYVEPGNEGRLLAFQVVPGAAADTLVWAVVDGAVGTGIPLLPGYAASMVKTLPADSARKVYTAVQVAGDWRLIEFSYANGGDGDLWSLLGVASAPDARRIINWVRCGQYVSTSVSDASCSALATGGRFGPSGAKSRLGGFLRSMPAVLTAPNTPYWRGSPTTSTEENEAIDDLVADLATRPNLVVAGARDGMIHAFYTNPADETDASNGTEVWAFIPPSVAAAFGAEYADDDDGDAVAGCAADADDCPYQDLWPDGSVRFFDYWDGDASVDDGVASGIGGYRTAMVAGLGMGGFEYFAIDVTETVDLVGAAPGTPACATTCEHGTPCNSGSDCATLAGDCCNMRLLWRYLDTATDPGLALSLPMVTRFGDIAGALDPPATGPPPTPDFRVVFGSGPPRQSSGATVTSKLKSVRLREATGNSHNAEVVWTLAAPTCNGGTGYFAAPPTYADTIDERAGGAYSQIGDGTTDYLVIGDTRGCLHRVSRDAALAWTYTAGTLPITAPATVAQSGSDAWFLVGAGGFDFAAATAAAGQIVAVSESGAARAGFPITLGAGEQVYANIVLAESNAKCFVATARSDYFNVGASCIAQSGRFGTFNCSTGTAFAPSMFTSGAALGGALPTADIGAVRSTLYARGGVVCFTTTHGDVVCSGSGGGQTTVQPGEQLAMSRLWWREVW